MFRKLILPVLAIVLIIGAGFTWMQLTPPMAAAEETTTATTSEETTSTTADVNIKEMTLGADDAPVTIVEYASYTCPHCANFNQGVFKQLKSEYVDTGKVRFVIHDVYFDRFGLWAAMLARCDGGNKFFGLSDLIYERQKEWTKGESNAEIVQNLMKLGRLAGMDDDTMNACLQDNAKAQALVADYQENAEKDGIDSTPSFVINGKKYSNMSLADFKQVIDALLKD
ncbi:MAG: DsbA family protein [Rhodobacteraceae bacterium]|nr:DsbA family protein [Paracoccaceae bacterium]